MIQAFITPELVRWARERCHLSVDQAARKLSVKPDQITSWETGDGFPTIKQAQRLAQRLFVPFGYLFLPSPPKEQIPLPDLRTVPGYASEPPSPDFIDLLDEVLRKQQWYSEHLEEEGREPLGFIGRFNAGDDIKQVSGDIRKTLRIDERLRTAAVSWEDFLRKLIRNAEEVGILVLRSSIVGNNAHRKLSVAEFRGFVISAARAPLVFINASDAKAAQIFTLAHELAHLWIGQSGISNLDFRQRIPGQNNRIEQFCNRVAAEVLVPEEGIVARWTNTRSIEENLQILARYYRVSTLVILRRAYDLNKLKWNDYINSYEEEIRKQKTKTGEEGGDFYLTLQSRNSSKLTRAIVSAAFEGRLLYRDAADFLSVHVMTLEKIAKKVGIR